MTIQVLRLPIQDYTTALTKMREYTLNRTADTVDQLWLLEHQPVFTQGQAGKAEHILNAGLIPIVQSDRGGQVTYHGPGQLVIYFLLDLQRKKIKIRGLIDIIEQSIINLLATYNILAHTKVNAPGIYVDGAKICSLGLRVREGCTYHGLSLNVNMDLEPFTRINPCGYADLPMTQISDFQPNISLNSCIDRLLPILTKTLQYASTT